ncbi:MAG: Mov34/MPN/PAD-1 family protein [Nitrososphaeria archaeon]
MKTRIYPLALGKILKHSLTNVRREVIGLLVGKMQGSVLEVWDAVTGRQRGNPGYVELHEEVQADVAEKLREETSGLYVVGWYHSHPGMGLFLSGIDIETQRRYQALFPKAVALVIDPIIYKTTRQISDLRFRVFRLGKRGQVLQNVVSVGAGRNKVLQSTLYGLSTLDIRHVLDVDFKPDQGLTIDRSIEKDLGDDSSGLEQLVNVDGVDRLLDPVGNAGIPTSFAEYLLLRIGSVKGLIAMALAAVAIMVLVAFIFAIG